MARLLSINVGDKYGSLTVVNRVGSKRGAALWKCLCECGNHVEAMSSTLRGGQVKSCGCLLSKGRPADRLVGQRFNKLLVLGDVGASKYGRRLLCLCDCGVQKEITAHNLTSGRIVSCGCAFYDSSEKRRLNRDKRTYQSWKGMLARCYNKKHPGYINYGARGITVCTSWKDYECFLEDMGLRPPGKSLDRVRNDEGYSKENCKWSTPAEQQRNTRVNRKFAFEGAELPVSEIAEKAGIPYHRAWTRLVKYGWSAEECIKGERVCSSN